MQRIAIERVREGGKLPRAYVPRQVQHAFATPLALQKVFMAVENDESVDILPRVSREARKFRRHPTEIAKHPANNRFALGFIPIGESDLQIDLCRFPQSRE